MRVRVVLQAIAPICMLLAACASGGSRGSAVFQREIGNASGIDAMSRSLLILNRYQYQIIDQDTIPDIRIETEWRPRRPFADEQALGVSAAETRVIVTGRVRGETAVGSVYNVRMMLENRVRIAGSLEWNEKTNTTMFLDYANGITEEFRKEFVNIGVRRYAP